MADRLGLDCKLYTSSTALDGSSNTPSTVSWTEQGNVRDVTLSLDKEEADVTRRDNDGWRATVGSLKNASLEFDVIFDDADAFYGDLRDAFLNNTDITLMILTGADDSDGEEGFAANWSITGFTRNESLTEAVTYNVTLKPHTQMQAYTVDT